MAVVFVASEIARESSHFYNGFSANTDLKIVVEDHLRQFGSSRQLARLVGSPVSFRHPMSR
jgi:hypothetical protein